jgi:hypothetical protein
MVCGVLYLQIVCKVEIAHVLGEIVPLEQCVATGNLHVRDGVVADGALAHEERGHWWIEGGGAIVEECGWVEG